MSEYTYYCKIDGAELDDDLFPTHEQVVEQGLDPEICLGHQNA